MSDANCETCRFYHSRLILNAEGKWHPPFREEGLTPAEYDQEYDDETAGVCRRFPPSSEGRFPDVLLIDWCGEYQPRTPLPMVPPA